MLIDLTKKIDISSSPLCFLTTWAKNPGNSILRTFLNKPLEIGYLIKNILSISKNHDLSFFCNKKLDINNNIQVVISYSTKNNFDKDGVFMITISTLITKIKKIYGF